MLFSQTIFDFLTLPFRAQTSLLPQIMSVCLLVGLGVLGCKTKEAVVAGPKACCDTSGMLEAITGEPRLPGVVSVDKALVKRLAASLGRRPDGYKPRTEHLNKDGSPKFTNRLIDETSPYLLQHAHNPVNWYPWSDEAFERAAEQDKPIFLSVGYSTCHWCHVMERESFEDEEIAAYLNKNFIAIKVDREERPDIDGVYMTAVSILTGRGGWPMTIVMTPDRRPFFGGTYFPPRAGVRGSRQGLLETLQQLVELYKNDRDAVIENAAALSERVRQATQWTPGIDVPTAAVISNAASGLSRGYDHIWGGFGRAPKFPQPSRLALLMRYVRRTGDKNTLKMVTHTLHKMADGGMYDHVAGGFHRYSTDSRWLVPHFEKMLYDNAQLAITYTEGWQLTQNKRFKRVASEILDYVSREMVSKEGGFYSATDADSLTPSGHFEEGYFFTWTPKELREVLKKSDAKKVEVLYGVTEKGNFEGRTIFHLPAPVKDVAERFGHSEEAFLNELVQIKKTLREVREKRPAPGLDDKVITAWNGWMIAAMARGGRVFDNDVYLGTSTRAANFVFDKLFDDELGLRRIYKDGVAKGEAFLSDYAAMVFASIELFQATGDVLWVNRALQLQKQLDAQYWDEAMGGYFLTSHRQEALLVRDKPVNDSAIPSGNAVTAANLVRLAELTGNTAFSDRAQQLFAFTSAMVARAPLAFPYMLSALDGYLDVPLEVVLVSPAGAVHDSALTKALRESFLPNGVLAVVFDDEVAEAAKVIPWLSGKASMKGKTTAYVCERGNCELPTSNVATFKKQISKVRPYVFNSKGGT